MANDNTLAALLAGGTTAPIMDPTIAGIGQTSELAKAMAQASLSSAPAAPMQAYGRLAQALASTYLSADAQRQMADLSAGAAEEIARTLPGTPLAKAARSPSPLARMVAVQEFGKAALAGSMPETIAPGGQRWTGDHLVAESTAPQSTDAQRVRDAEFAAARGNPAGAAAIGRSITKAGSTPEGVPYSSTPVVPPAPISPTPVRTVQPGRSASGLQGVAERGHTPAQAAGAAYGVPVGAAASPGSPQGEGNDMPSRVAAAAGKKAAAEAGAKADFESGGTMTVPSPWGPQEIPITAATRAKMQPPIPGGATFNDRYGASGLSGKPLPNPAIEPLVKADAEELAKDRESALKGQQDMATVRMIQDFLPKVKTGWSAENKLEAARILKGLGTSDDKIAELMRTDVASGQILQKKFLELSSAAARNMGAREPGSVISMFAKAYPNLGTDEKAVRLQTNALYMDRLRAQRLAEEKTNYLNDSVNDVQRSGQYRGLKGFNEDFGKQHAPETYLSASEAMSGVPQAWQRIKDPRQQSAVIDLIPSGSTYMSPDGKLRIKP